MSLSDGRLRVAPGEAPEEGANVWLMAYDESHQTRVAAGENAGRALENYHVVREMERLGVWRGEALDLPVDLASLRDAGRSGVAFLVQQAGQGPILGALEVELDE